ncbi:hypothetical protein BD413DRAFT_119795 [Trametes elegans]|nr:hypothetical protein BD413DRAFT_119795 [Trametes elegans]
MQATKPCVGGLSSVAYGRPASPTLTESSVSLLDPNTSLVPGDYATKDNMTVPANTAIVNYDKRHALDIVTTRVAHVHDRHRSTRLSLTSQRKESKSPLTWLRLGGRRRLACTWPRSSSSGLSRRLTPKGRRDTTHATDSIETNSRPSRT